MKHSWIKGLAFTAVYAASTAVFAAEDADHNQDYRTFNAGGAIEYGNIGDSYTAELVMYLAGNQFMVMEELITDFQSRNPDIKTIYVETIPPGQILKGQTLKQAGTCCTPSRDRKILPFKTWSSKGTAAPPVPEVHE